MPNKFLHLFAANCTASKALRQLLQQFAPAPQKSGSAQKGVCMKSAKTFNPHFYEDQRQLLLAHKERLLNGLRSTDELKMSSDDLLEEGDLGQAILNQNYALSLRERDLQRLREIDQALMRIQDGTYGICEETGGPIGEGRLKKIPWTTLSIEAAEELERENRKFGGRA